MRPRGRHLLLPQRLRTHPHESSDWAQGCARRGVPTVEAYSALGAMGPPLIAHWPQPNGRRRHGYCGHTRERTLRGPPASDAARFAAARSNGPLAITTDGASAE
eukprot:465928-Prymnesium_polylepis.1